MRIQSQFYKCATLTALLFTGFTAGSFAQNITTTDNQEKKAPVIETTTPSGNEDNVDNRSVIEIIFSSEMDEATINENTLLLHANSDDEDKMHHREYRDNQNRNDQNRHDQMREQSENQYSEKNRQDKSGSVSGTISYSDKVAVFTPNEDLKEGTTYTFTVTSDVKSSDNVALENDHDWTFTTSGSADAAYSDRYEERQVESQDNRRNDQQVERRDDRQDDRQVERRNDRQEVEQGTDRYGIDRNDYSQNAMNTTRNDSDKMIELGTAGQFVILAKTDINNRSGSNITGQTGEGSVSDNNNKEKAFADSVRQSTNDRVAVWQRNESDTTSADVTEALEDMLSAYNSVPSQNGDRALNGDEREYDFDQNRDQERRQDRDQDMRQDRDQDGQQDRDDVTTHQDDHIPAEDLEPGVHQWSNALNVHSDFTLSGSENDVWIFKVGGDLTIDEDFVLTLSDGAHADNIFWYVEGEVTIGKNAEFEGIILSMNDITLENGAKLNGRMFSQASITLDDNTITEPTRLIGQTSSTNR